MELWPPLYRSHGLLESAHWGVLRRHSFQWGGRLNWLQNIGSLGCLINFVLTSLWCQFQVLVNSTIYLEIGAVTLLIYQKQQLAKAQQQTDECLSCRSCDATCYSFGYKCEKEQQWCILTTGRLSGLEHRCSQLRCQSWRQIRCKKKCICSRRSSVRVWPNDSQTRHSVTQLAAEVGDCLRPTSTHFESRGGKCHFFKTPQNNRLSESDVCESTRSHRANPTIHWHETGNKKSMYRSSCNPLILITPVVFEVFVEVACQEPQKDSALHGATGSK